MVSAEPKVEVLTISKIRFGDPVTALCIGRSSVLHGSIMGRVVHYSFEAKADKELVDMSSEMVREITLSSDGAYYYIANGDAGWHLLPENGLSPMRTFTVEVKGSHAQICERSYTFQYGNHNCIIVLGPEDEDDKRQSEGSLTSGSCDLPGWRRSDRVYQPRDAHHRENAEHIFGVFALR